MRLREGAAIGDGPVDAICKAISQVTQHLGQAGEIRDPRRDQRHRGAWAKSPCNWMTAAAKSVGRGASTDVIEASAKAYIDGLNKLDRKSSRQS